MKDIGPPRGMRDMLPEEALRRQALIARIRETYESYGYRPMDTPAMERLEYLLDKGGSETDSLMFRVLKRGEKLAGSSGTEELSDLGLRYDLTVSLCRYYASNAHLLPKLFRRYQIGPVWRADRPQRGRFREFYQCDVDLVGAEMSFPECEVILATRRALARLGMGSCHVRMSDRRLLPAVFGAMGFSPAEASRAMVSVDKIDKIGVDGVAGEAGEYLDAAKCGLLRDFLAECAEGAGAFDLAALGTWGGRAGEATEPVVRSLAEISEAVRAASVEPVDVRFAPCLVRGMAYYTGPIFEIWDGESPFSLAGGGRYDGLVGKFLGREVPACGFSIGFERILTVLAGRAGGEPATPARVLLMIRHRDLEPRALALSEDLRNAGVPVEVFPFERNIKAQFAHAEGLGIEHLLVLSAGEGGAPAFELIHGPTRTRTSGDWPALRTRLVELAGR